jgi:tRNA pseudouridine55 synthase
MESNNYSGWIFIDKPEGKTSFDIIRNIKKILKIKKIGHSGTLDPIASGILGIGIGEATKSIPFFSKRKEYKFEITFGESKDTDDISGKTTMTSQLIPTIGQISNCLNEFIGTISQIPPNYSAVKVNGMRAYKLARNNINFELKEKKIKIYSLQCTGQIDSSTFSFIIDCSSGTYIRSLARDIAKKMNTLGYISYLRRTKLGKITEKDIILVDKFNELVHIGDHFELMHSIQDVLDDIQAVRLDKEFSQKFQNGLTFDYCNKKVYLKPIVIFSETKFLGIGEINKGDLKPVRVFNS